jgi:hypothetical protein
MLRKLVVMSLLGATLLSLGAISALAQDIKIGYIDSIKIFAENQETQDAERL